MGFRERNKAYRVKTLPTVEGYAPPSHTGIDLAIPDRARAQVRDVLSVSSQAGHRAVIASFYARNRRAELLGEGDYDSPSLLMNRLFMSAVGSVASLAVFNKLERTSSSPPEITEAKDIYLASKVDFQTDMRSVVNLAGDRRPAQTANFLMQNLFEASLLISNRRNMRPGKTESIKDNFDGMRREFLVLRGLNEAELPQAEHCEPPDERLDRDIRVPFEDGTVVFLQVKKPRSPVEPDRRVAINPDIEPIRVYVDSAKGGNPLRLGETDAWSVADTVVQKAQAA